MNFHPPTAAEQREYARLRDVARRFGVLQVGVSCFEAPTSGAVAAADFSASTFNFTVFPGFGAQAFEPQSLQFVGRHGFDFNKYVNEGVPYVKPSAPRPVTRRGANDGSMIRTPRAQQAGAGRGGRDNGAGVGSTAAARRFGNGVGGEMDFTDVMACVQASGCPIVGHNASFDLAYAMEHFVHPVPNSVSDFAKALLQAFGTVYDTKVITKNRGTAPSSFSVFARRQALVTHTTCRPARCLYQCMVLPRVPCLQVMKKPTLRLCLLKSQALHPMSCTHPAFSGTVQATLRHWPRSSRTRLALTPS